jgi:hypothetical protein
MTAEIDLELDTCSADCGMCHGDVMRPRTRHNSNSVTGSPSSHEAHEDSAVGIFFYLFFFGLIVSELITVALAYCTLLCMGWGWELER